MRVALAPGRWGSRGVELGHFDDETQYRGRIWRGYYRTGRNLVTESYAGLVDRRSGGPGRLITYESSPDGCRLEASLWIVRYSKMTASGWLSVGSLLIVDTRKNYDMNCNI